MPSVQLLWIDVNVVITVVGLITEDSATPMKMGTVHGIAYHIPWQQYHISLFSFKHARLTCPIELHATIHYVYCEMQNTIHSSKTF